MSETTDNLQGAISEETTAVQQTGSEGSSNTEAMKAEIARLQKQVENANKLIGRKAVDVQTLQALGMTQGQQQQVSEMAQNMTQREGQQLAQAMGVDDAQFKKTVEKYGFVATVNALMNKRLEEMLQDKLAPLGNYLTAARDKTNNANLRSAVTRLADEHDIEGHAEAIAKYWQTPMGQRKYAALMHPDTDEDEKLDILETAYLKVSNAKQNNSSAAAKAAGAEDAKQRETMKNSTVTQGSGSGKRNDSPPSDGFEEALERYQKGKNLFG